MHSALRNVLAASVVLAGVSLTPNRSDAALITLDFGTVGGSYGDLPALVPGGAYTEDSFTVSAEDSSGGTDPGYHFDLVDFGPDGDCELFMHSGLDAGPSSHADWVRVTRADAFDLLSLDVLLLLSPTGAPPADLLIVTSLGGMQTLTVGTNTFTGALFEGITSFDIKTSPLPLDDSPIDRYRFIVDDIVLGVPEPSSLLFILGGLAVLAARGSVSTRRD